MAELEWPTRGSGVEVQLGGLAHRVAEAGQDEDPAPSAQGRAPGSRKRGRAGSTDGDVAPPPAKTRRRTPKSPKEATKPAGLGKQLASKPLHVYHIDGQGIDGARRAMQASSALLHSDAWATQPTSYRERRLSVVVPQSESNGIVCTQYDKAFCVDWINPDVLAVSTKCGNILRVNARNMTHTAIDLVGETPREGADEDESLQRIERGGIHCVRANQSKALLACSGGREEDNNVYVLDLSSDKWATVRRGCHHKDWVFTLSWVSDTSFITGSRDQSVVLWNPYEGKDFDMQPMAVYDRAHDAKVRCSGFDRDTQRLATLDVRGSVVLWDAVGAGDMRVLHRFKLKSEYQDECTCMMLDNHMLAVGARRFMTLYDPRRADAIASVPIAKLGYSLDHVLNLSIAARSIQSKGCLLSVGLSTDGRVMFIDKRKMNGGVLPPDTAAAPSALDYSGDGVLRWRPLPGERSAAPPGRPVDKKAAAALASCLGLNVGACLPPWVASAPAVRARSVVAEFGASATNAADASMGPSYNLRQRNTLKAPERFASLRRHTRAEQVAAKVLSQSTPTIDLTRSVLPVVASIQQPKGEVHYDALSYYDYGIDNAVFSHAWAPEGDGIFTCGGPLAMGIRGCYLARWN